MDRTVGKTVVVLTALDLEYEAVRRYLTDLEFSSHHAGTLWEIGDAPDRSCRIALNAVGKGNLSAAVLAERAVAAFDPLALLFVGVAGARRDDIELGDVVVASHVYGYHGGTSEDDRFNARPRVWEAPHELDQLAGDIARSESWIALLRGGYARKPAAYRAPIAAGEVVLQSRTSTEARRIREHYNDAAAVEMEGAGFAQAAQLNARPSMVIRGISDYANADKTNADRQGYQHVAARHAAAFAVTLAQRAAEAQSSREPARRRSASEPVAASVPTVSNVAHGGAHVGIQAGQIFGGAYVNQPAPAQVSDVGTLLKQLGEAIEDAYRAGRLDAETYESAREELSTATDAKAPEGERPPRKFVLALKRLKGMVDDVAGLGAKIATILSLGSER
ncbi:MAG TPA: 5'-methylthioadenosine/S-adenosylhomocysteine nucleosidase [Actinopolymorphaceae bacterium]